MRDPISPSGAFAVSLRDGASAYLLLVSKEFKFCIRH